MPSSPKIPKDRIVQTALRILIREGYAAITIQRIARELNCSTQPISWQFGGMDNFREALAAAAMEHVGQRLTSQADNPVAAFEQLGRAYVDVALDEPNLFCFICMGGSGRHVEGGLLSLLDRDRNVQLQQALADTLHITMAQAETFMNTMVIYAHGIAAMVASGVVRETKEQVHAMLRETGLTLLSALGLGREEADKLLQA